MKPYCIIGQNYRVDKEMIKEYCSDRINYIQKIFPDGEKYVRILDTDKITGKDVVLINTLYPRQNDSFIETLFLIDSLRRTFVRKLVVIIPYLAYSRQDKQFLPGEPVSAEVIIKSIREAGADQLVVIDAHNPQSLRSFNGCTINVLVSDILVNKALEYVENPIVLAPDKGALKRVEYAAVKYGLEYDYLVKSRDRITGEISMTSKELNVHERDVIIVDDIISTGGTIALAIRHVKKQGARKVVVAASHGLMVGNALEKIKGAGVEKIILGNTLGIKHNDSTIEYVEVLGKALELLS
ncbi:MAG: ribose-phosphate diphosphokinase [Staphylothermus sp.]|nr:ribose-phosphate diphosphokinase [Staphylothermus sp.]